MNDTTAERFTRHRLRTQRNTRTTDLASQMLEHEATA
jgi:hypothetical protein